MTGRRGGPRVESARSPAPPDRRPTATPKRGPRRRTTPRPSPPRSRRVSTPERGPEGPQPGAVRGRDWTCPRAERSGFCPALHLPGRAPLRPPPRHKEAPKSLSRTLDCSLQPAGQRDRAHAGRDPEWVGGVGSAGGSRGSRLPHALPGPGRGRGGCCPGATGAGRGAAPRRRAARGGARGRTHRAELLGSVLHAPGSGCGAGCSLESPACAAAALRLRSTSPAPPRPPGPPPSPQPGPAQRAPRPPRPQPSPGPGSAVLVHTPGRVLCWVLARRPPLPAFLMRNSCPDQAPEPPLPPSSQPSFDSAAQPGSGPSSIFASTVPPIPWDVLELGTPTPLISLLGPSSNPSKNLLQRSSL